MRQEEDSSDGLPENSAKTPGEALVVVVLSLRGGHVVEVGGAAG